MQSWEECDDGNAIGSDGCDDCRIVMCGNGVVEGTEICDDGNVIDGDGCSSSCRRESAVRLGEMALCGDGILDPDEFCDDGNLIDGDDCSSFCTREGPAKVAGLALCGDGIMAQDEECETGYPCRNGGFCTKTCRCVLRSSSSSHGSLRSSVSSQPPSPVCGNGVLESGEECDDGNLIDGDGCTYSCFRETTPKITVPALCGDGIMAQDEECDDGNRNNGDGCSAGCIMESPFLKRQPVTVDALEVSLVPEAALPTSSAPAAPRTGPTPKKNPASASAPTTAIHPAAALPEGVSSASSEPQSALWRYQADLIPYVPASGVAGQTGPASAAIMATGAAAALAWIRRRRSS